MLFLRWTAYSSFTTVMLRWVSSSWIAPTRVACGMGFHVAVAGGVSKSISCSRVTRVAPRWTINLACSIYFSSFCCCSCHICVAAKRYKAVQTTQAGTWRRCHIRSTKAITRACSCGVSACTGAAFDSRRAIGSPQRKDGQLEATIRLFHLHWDRTHHPDSTGSQAVEGGPMLSARDRQHRLRATQEHPGLPGRINPDGSAATHDTAFLVPIYL